KTADARKIADPKNLETTNLTGDPLVLNAHWLVLMHQSRFDEALTSAQAFLKAPAEFSVLPALRAEVTIHTIKKNYREAIIAADRLAQALPAEGAAADKPADLVSGTGSDEI